MHLIGQFHFLFYIHRTRNLISTVNTTNTLGLHLLHSFTTLVPTDTCKDTNTCAFTIYWHILLLFVYMRYVVLNIDCPSPTAGAGDVVAAALPNLKCLRKVTVWHMNPVPVLQTVGVCVKLQEVSVWDPKHCEVGMRCAYRWM